MFLFSEAIDGLTIRGMAADEGRRVAVDGWSTTTFYAYLSTEPLYEKTGSVFSQHVFADGLRIAKVSGGAASYYHADIIGSTRLVASPTGTVLFSNSYQPFGQNNATPLGS